MCRAGAGWSAALDMSTVGLRLVRLALGFASLALLAALAALIALPHLAPIAGRQLLVMNGDAMAGSLPAGALVSVRHADPATIEAGDVVTFRTEGGTLVTRRAIEAVVPGRSFIRAGTDAASEEPAVVVPVAALVGVAEAYVPHAGSVLAALATALGATVALALSGGPLLAYWLVDDTLVGRRAASSRGREPSVQPVG
jgi:hypothetical protein